MKIALLDMDNLRNPHWGGGQAVLTHEIGKRIAKKHEITVYCSKYPGFNDYQKDGITYHHVGLGTRFSKLNNLAYVLLLPLTTMRISDADVIVECFNAPFSTTCTQWFTKTPVVGYATFFFAKQLSRKYKLPFFIVEAFGLKAYKYLIALNEGDAQRMRQTNRKAQVFTIPEGVDEAFFTIPRLPAKHILCLGRFDMQQKGIDLLLEAYKTIADQISLPLVIAGKGPDKAAIEQKIKALGLTDKVRLLGPTYGKAKDSVLSEAAVVCIPSRIETFCVFGLEALAAGVPVVSFAIPALTWLSNKVAVKAKPFSIDDYGQGIIQMLAASQSAAFTDECRSFAAQFSWDAVADQFDKALTTAVTDHQNYLAAKKVASYA